MANKPTATAKITPAQKAALIENLAGRSESDFVREAIREKFERNGWHWPAHDWLGHGGKRAGSGRKKQSPEPPENGG